AGGNQSGESDFLLRPRMSYVLGFDFGARCIGVASGNRISLSARPLAALTARAGQPDWPRIDALLAEWKPDALVVGLPLTLDGGEQPVTRHARAFAAAMAPTSIRWPPPLSLRAGWPRPIRTRVNFDETGIQDRSGCREKPGHGRPFWSVEF